MSSSPAPAPPIDSVTLERWPSYGGPPGYAVTVHVGGRVERNDMPELDPEGLAATQGRAEPEAVAAVFRLFDTPFFEGIVRRQAAGVSDDDPTGTPFGFGPPATDTTGATLTVRRGGEVLSFRHEFGAGFDSEVHVYRLEAAVDRAAETAHSGSRNASPWRGRDR